MAYPTSPAETLADAAVHLIGLAFAIPAALVLLTMAADLSLPVLPTALYAACMVFAFAASAIYHLLPFERIRPALGRVDHAAIYFKIAGTYTPLVMLIGTGFAYAILGVVWALAACGALAKLWFWRTDARGSLALYLGMGWLSVLLVYPMWQNLPGAALALIALGGALYSLGTIVYARDGMRYQNAIWHVFVLLASVLFFAAIHLSLSAHGLQVPGL
ncbi:hemolysin III family protein [Sulfitobacter aestuarii]|uniref:Hemolysin III family protein n=1 Tax=Sulfitobacter aestuarii TaxID=2161676 RepID=A0ABW5U4S7_9RHOB